MNRRYPLVVAALVLAIAQIGFLSWIVMGRAAVLRDGREVVFQVKPVDPRDLLRGDYVRLGYDFSDIPAALVTNKPQDGVVDEGTAVFVVVKKDAEGLWKPVAASLDTPPAEPATADELVLRGSARYYRDLASYSSLEVEYGIERFYLPEGEGRAIEQDITVRSFFVKVALAEDGAPQIKALMDGEIVLYEEPLY